jgi:hypothetical protein
MISRKLASKVWGFSECVIVITADARLAQAMEAVRQTEGRLSTSEAVNVLRGTNSAKVRTELWDNLTSFGAGKKVEKATLERLLHHMVPTHACERCEPIGPGSVLRRRWFCTGAVEVHRAWPTGFVCRCRLQDGRVCLKPQTKRKPLTQHLTQVLTQLLVEDTRRSEGLYATVTSVLKVCRHRPRRIRKWRLPPLRPRADRGRGKAFGYRLVPTLHKR